MFHEHTKFREWSRKFATGGNENYYDAPVCPTGNRKSIEKHQDFVVAIKWHLVCFLLGGGQCLRRRMIL